MNAFKLLVIGPPSGPQTPFVGTVCQVKVKSSTHTPGQDFVPLDFGRVRVDDNIDLQIFGVERDRAGVIADAVSPGIVGAVLILEKNDAADPRLSSETLEELKRRDIAFVVAATSKWGERSLRRRLPFEEDIIICNPRDKESVKSVILKVLESALAAIESAA